MIVKGDPFFRKGFSPQGERRVQRATGYRTDALVDVHTCRGQLRNGSKNVPPPQRHPLPR